MLTTLTPGFRLIALDDQLSIQSLSLLADTVRWTVCVDHEYERLHSDDDEVFLMSFDPRANSAKAMKMCRISRPDRVVERALCKALFVYHANLLGWTCRCSGYRRIVAELADALRLCDYQAPGRKGFWSWLTLLTANAARRSGLQQLQAEMMTKFVAFNNEGMGSWDLVQALLKRFLLHSKLSREWRMCWETASSSGTPQC